MASRTEPSAYILSYRNEEPEEHQRLNSQHDVIQQAILGDRLIHPSIRFSRPHIAIADIACGTGIWLEDVRKNLVVEEKYEAPVLVGFDVNGHGFDTSLMPAIRLIQHDCTEDFPEEYVGQFDLVNMRGLAFAVAQEGFSRVVANAVRLLRPEGYLQWLETDTRLFRQFPSTSEFSEAIASINDERARRGLVKDLPHFMLKEMLKFSNSDPTASSQDLASVDVLHFNLLPGGICRDPTRESDPLNRRFSDTVLESLKVALAGLLRQDNGVSDNNSAGDQLKTVGPTVDSARIRRLVDAIDASKQSADIIAGGMFPHMVARKSGE